MARVSEVGIYALPVDEYHLDPCADGPSMSASNAETLLDESARHCWHKHPRLNPEAAEAFDPEQMDGQKRLKMEHGTALHTLILGAGRPIFEVVADDYRTKAAKEARADALAQGMTPILTMHKPKLIDCARAVAEQVKVYPELRRVLEAPGRAERTLLWQEPVGTRKGKGESIWCRALVDWLPDDPGQPLVDFLFTGGSASPASYGPSIGDKLAVRASHYMRGAQRVRGRTPRGYWTVAVETNEPYGVCVYAADQALQHYAREQWADAAARWHACLQRGTEPQHWPFWKPTIHEIEAKPWQIRQWEDTKLAEAIKPTARGMVSIKRVQALAEQMGSPVA